MADSVARIVCYIDDMLVHFFTFRVECLRGFQGGKKERSRTAMLAYIVAVLESSSKDGEVDG